jgi:hypothetical protein
VLQRALVSTNPQLTVAVLRVLLAAWQLPLDQSQVSHLAELCQTLRVPQICQHRLTKGSDTTQQCLAVQLYAHLIFQNPSSADQPIKQFRSQLLALVCAKEQPYPLDSYSTDLIAAACQGIALDTQGSEELYSMLKPVLPDLANHDDARVRSCSQQLLSKFGWTWLPAPMLTIVAPSKRQHVEDELLAYEQGVVLTDMVPDCC